MRVFQFQSAKVQQVRISYNSTYGKLRRWRSAGMSVTTMPTVNTSPSCPIQKMLLAQFSAPEEMMNQIRTRRRTVLDMDLGSADFQVKYGIITS